MNNKNRKVSSYTQVKFMPNKDGLETLVSWIWTIRQKRIDTYCLYLHNQFTTVDKTKTKINIVRTRAVDKRRENRLELIRATGDRKCTFYSIIDFELRLEKLLSKLSDVDYQYWLNNFQKGLITTDRSFLPPNSHFQCYDRFNKKKINVFILQWRRKQLLRLGQHKKFSLKENRFERRI